MRPLLTAAALLLLTLVACSTAPSPAPSLPPGSITLPPPGSSNQYDARLLCTALEAHSYDIAATLNYNVTASTLSPVLDRLPPITRRAVDAYLGPGYNLQLTIDSLCASLAR